MFIQIFEQTSEKSSCCSWVPICISCFIEINE